MLRTGSVARPRRRTCSKPGLKSTATIIRAKKPPMASAPASQPCEWPPRRSKRRRRSERGDDDVVDQRGIEMPAEREVLVRDTEPVDESDQTPGEVLRPRHRRVVGEGPPLSRAHPRSPSSRQPRDRSAAASAPAAAPRAGTPGRGHRAGPGGQRTPNGRPGRRLRSPGARRADRDPAVPSHPGISGATRRPTVRPPASSNGSRKRSSRSTLARKRPRGRTGRRPASRCHATGDRLPP